MARSAPRPDVELEAPAFAEQLRGKQSAAFDAAVRTGKKLSPEVASDLVQTAMRERDPDHRKRACEVARALRLDGCAAAAMALLDDPESRVRMVAAELLRTVRNAPALLAVARRAVAGREDFLMG